jgi:hypothetical protein
MNGNRKRLILYFVNFTSVKTKKRRSGNLGSVSFWLLAPSLLGFSDASSKAPDP